MQGMGRAIFPDDSEVDHMLQQSNAALKLIINADAQIISSHLSMIDRLEQALAGRESSSQPDTARIKLRAHLRVWGVYTH